MQKKGKWTIMEKEEKKGNRQWWWK